jgi:hypothetical protein
MKRNLAVFALGLTLLIPVTASAQAQTSSLQPGERVMVNSLGQMGTVVQIGGPASPGSSLIKVHLDSLPAGFPQQGSWFDEKLSGVTPMGGAAGAPAATPQAYGQPAPAYGQPAPGYAQAPAYGQQPAYAPPPAYGQPTPAYGQQPNYPNYGQPPGTPASVPAGSPIP